MDLPARFDCVIQPPERLTTIESWHRHMPFACAMLAMLKPKLLVELGTHRGDSYSNFCQAVVHQQLPTRCYAVDTWQGDAHAGEYSNEVYDDLRQWHDPRYGAFSSLLRMTFDQALEHFEDGSVDLLHIDGLHTYEAVKHDFDSWLPKLSPHAVVLFHDTNVRYDDFAVWQLWAELEQQYPAFEFPFGFGLGVLAVGDKVPAEVLDFINYAQTNPRSVVDFFYRHGDAAEVRKKQAEIERLNERLEDVGSQLSHARTVVEARDQALGQAQLQLHEQEQQLETLLQQFAVQGVEQVQHQDSLLQHARSQLFAAQHENLALLRNLSHLGHLVQNQQAQLRMVLGSRLWRLRNQGMRVLGLGHRQVRFTPLQLPAMTAAQIQRLSEVRPAVTIIVPVYRGLEDTRSCIESILASAIGLSYQLVVINDASPELELVQWLNDNSQRFTLLHNSHNLGFVGTVNRGMALYPEQDVVLVNSDTEVANNWLDRLQAAAYSAPNVGSVTPFSNNATICSFPLFCQDNSLPAGHTVASLDGLFAQANAGQSVDIPTAVGFCMYIRRVCLLEAGLFDQDRFGRGYGEENEFCLRSSAYGWRHLLAGDVFVYHKGGVSFAETQSEHQRRGHAALLELFPNYDWIIQQHIAADPAARLRFAAEMALVRASGLPVVLMVNHGRGGGAQRHMQELAATLAGQVQLYCLQLEGNLLRLRSMANEGQHAALYFDPQVDTELLLATLRQLAVSRVHYHHLIDLPELVQRLPELLGCSYDFTVHDFYLACPQVTLADAQGQYCGAPNEAGCNSCLQQRPLEGVTDIDSWRTAHLAMLGGAERVFVPSLDTLQRISSYFPQVGSWCYAPHSLAPARAIQLQPLGTDEPLRVVVLGALSAFKGADTLEQVALAARRARLPLEFHLLGYAYRRLRTQPVSALQVHGAYQETELAERLAELQPHVVWFAGNCPETWSYTLTAALDSGLPVVATRIGAFSERLVGRGWSWLQQVNSSADDWLKLLEAVRLALLEQQPPLPQALELAKQPVFDYADDYSAGLVAVAPAEPVAEADNGQWLDLHSGWQQAARTPVIELLPQVSNPTVRKLLVFALRRGWLQPLVARVPVSVVQRVKQLLTRG